MLKVNPKEVQGLRRNPKRLVLEIV